VREINEFVGAR